MKKVLLFMLSVMLIAFVVGCQAEKSQEETKEPTKAEVEQFVFDEPINISVPFKVGGALDTRARVVAKYLEQEIGQTIAVTNPTGAGGVVGTNEFITQKGGAYDVIFLPATVLTLNPITAEVAYMVGDLTPIASCAIEIFGLYTNPEKTGIETFDDLVEYGKENRIKFGSGGPPNITNLLQAALYEKLGLKADTVPHHGANEGLTNCLGGHVDVTLAGTALAKGFVDEGELTAILVFGKEDDTSYEVDYRVPSVAKLDYDTEDFVYESLMFFAMKSTSDPAAQEAMYNAIMKVYENPDCIEDLKKLGVNTIVKMNTEEINAHLKAESEALGSMIEIVESIED